jgi:hypothetical protein
MPAGIIVPTFSATLTTVAFDHSRSRWLGIDDLIAEPEGPSFSCVAPCGPAMLVTQDPFRTPPVRRNPTCATPRAAFRDVTRPVPSEAAGAVRAG